ncbi:MAG: hypothetical protein ACE5I1_31475, partial [bacterium]
GSAVWICTDRGLNSFDGTTWVTYKKQSDGGTGEILISGNSGNIDRRITSTALSHNFVFGMDLQGNTIWVATAKGVSRGEVNQ